MNHTLSAQLPRTTAAFDKKLDRIDALLGELPTIKPRFPAPQRTWRDILRLLNRVSVSVRANDDQVRRAAIDGRKAEYFYPFNGTPAQQRAFYEHAYAEGLRATKFITTGLARELAHDANKLRLYSWCELHSVVPRPLVG